MISRFSRFSCVYRRLRTRRSRREIRWRSVRSAGLCERLAPGELALGFQPVIERRTVGATACLVQLVGESRDLRVGDCRGGGCVSAAPRPFDASGWCGLRFFCYAWHSSPLTSCSWWPRLRRHECSRQRRFRRFCRIPRALPIELCLGACAGSRENCCLACVSTREMRECVIF
jgi:hypothetical protein